MDVSSLSILGAAQVIFLCFLIFTNRNEKSLSKKILIAWLVTILLNLIFYWSSFTGNTAAFDLLLFCWGAEIVHGPLIYFYVLSVLDREWKLGWMHVFHFWLYIIMTALIFYEEYIVGNHVSITNGYIIFENGAPKALLNLLFPSKIIILIYLGYSIYLIRKKQTIITHYYTAYDKINFMWLQKFVIVLSIGYLIMYAVLPDVFNLVVLGDLEVAIINILISVSFSFYAAFINYKNQVELLHASYKVNVSALPSKKSTSTVLSESEINEILNALRKYMNSEKPYLNPNLTLRELSSLTNLPYYLISQAINAGLKKNFFSFINEYRIREFKNLIKMGLHDSLDLAGVASRCGFNSKSSFYEVFKKLEGITPTDFIKSSDSKKKSLAH